MPIQDRSRRLTQFEFEVTHSCNKNCPHCDHRISTSDYELNSTDYNYVIDRIGETKEIESVFLIGGEPLDHPNLDALILSIETDFPNAEIIIQTNGKLLPFYYHCTEPKVKWLLSEYPGWNDQIIKDYEGAPNVKIYRFNGMFWDITEDPNLSDADAQKARADCLFLCRVIGRNLYDCCLSEGIERDFKTEPVHVPFTENWREDIRTIKTWRACKHCFRAATILKSGTMYGKRTRSHDDKLKV